MSLPGDQWGWINPETGERRPGWEFTPDPNNPYEDWIPDYNDGFYGPTQPDPYMGVLPDGTDPRPTEPIIADDWFGANAPEVAFQGFIDAGVPIAGDSGSGGGGGFTSPQANFGQFSPSGSSGGGPMYTPPGQFSYESFQRPGQFQAPSLEAALNNPGYQFRLQEGQKALERSASSRGTLLTTGTLKDLTQYGQDMATQEYDKVYNRALGEYQTEYNVASDSYDRNRNNAFTAYTANADIGLRGQALNLQSALGFGSLNWQRESGMWDRNYQMERDRIGDAQFDASLAASGSGSSSDDSAYVIPPYDPDIDWGVGY